MADIKVTNWLLSGILLLLILHLMARGGPSVLAETFRLDDCITDKITHTPQSYVHVVTHSAD